MRPVRWLVAMLDGQTVPLEFDGIRAGKYSHGHRILTDAVVTIPRAGSAYVDALRAAKVLGRAEREQQIRKALDAATRTIAGARWREDKALLDIVVNVTEFPSAGPPVRWRVNIGGGYAGPAVAGNRVYVMDKQLPDGQANEAAKSSRLVCCASSPYRCRALGSAGAALRICRYKDSASSRRLAAAYWSARKPI